MTEPVIDPTALTTEALFRESASVRELVRSEIAHRKDLTDTQFAGIDKQLADLAARTAEQKTDNSKALADALTSAKELVALQTQSFDRSITKSEAAASKEIDALKVQISDLKSRMDRAESVKLGGSENSAAITRAIILASVLLGIAITLMGLFNK